MVWIINTVHHPLFGGFSIAFPICFFVEKEFCPFCKNCNDFCDCCVDIYHWHIGFSHVDARKKVYGKYIQGDYLTVEGEVENYMPDPDGANLPDRFSVEDIDFSIPGFTTVWGYPLRHVDGGELQNGLNVKIYYIPYKFENVIMKIVIFDD